MADLNDILQSQLSSDPQDTSNVADQSLVLSSNYLYQLDTPLGVLEVDMLPAGDVVPEQADHMISHYTFPVSVFQSQMSRHFSSIRSNEMDQSDIIGEDGSIELNDLQLEDISFPEGENYLVKSASFMRDILLGGKGAALTAFGEFGDARISRAGTADDINGLDFNTEGYAYTHVSSDEKSKFPTSGPAMASNTNRLAASEFAAITLSIVTSAIFGRSSRPAGLTGWNGDVDANENFAGLGVNAGQNRLQRAWITMSQEEFGARLNKYDANDAASANVIGLPDGAGNDFTVSARGRNTHVASLNPEDRQLYKNPLHLYAPGDDAMLRSQYVAGSDENLATYDIDTDNEALRASADGLNNRYGVQNPGSESMADGCALQYFKENRSDKPWVKNVAQQLYRSGSIKGELEKRIMRTDPQTLSGAEIDSDGDTRRNERYHVMWQDTDSLYLYFTLRASTQAGDAISGPDKMGAHYFLKSSQVSGVGNEAYEADDQGMYKNQAGGRFDGFRHYITQTNDETATRESNKAIQARSKLAIDTADAFLVDQTPANKAAADSAAAALAQSQGIVLRLKLEVIADPTTVWVGDQEISAADTSEGSNAIVNLKDRRLYHAIAMKRVWAAGYNSGDDGDAGDPMQSFKFRYPYGIDSYDDSGESPAVVTNHIEDTFGSATGETLQIHGATKGMADEERYITTTRTLCDILCAITKKHAVITDISESAPMKTGNGEDVVKTTINIGSITDTLEGLKDAIKSVFHDRHLSTAMAAAGGGTSHRINATTSGVSFVTLV